MLLYVFGIVAATLADLADPTTPSTDEEIPIVAGLRIHNIGDRGFHGYTEAWETVVEPDIEVRVVIFGHLLDKVEYMLVTDQVCTQPEFNISREGFLFQASSRIEFKFKFPLWDKPWRFCIKHDGPGEELQLIDDDRTWITTEIVHKKEHWIPAEIRYLIILFLLCLSALCSGLNLGLMNLSTQELNLIINSGSPTEIKYAKSILPIREKGNYLLCSILITNVVVNSAISILSEDLWAGFVALFVSAGGIVVFGEIIPQSVCYKYGLAVGAKTVWITRCFMLLTLPFAFPISLVLDWILGEDVDQFNRGRLVELLRMTTENEKDGESGLAEDLKIVVGAMEFSSKTAGNAMTRIDDVFMLGEDEILDNQVVAEIVKKGYSRIPVYYEHNRNNVRSILHVRDLAMLDKSSEITVRTIAEINARELRMVDEDMTLAKLLEEFKKGDYHLAMVYKHPQIFRMSLETESSNPGTPLLEETIEFKPDVVEPKFVGIITLEDIIEEILQSEILDEYDTVTDNVHRVKRQTSQGKITELFCCEKKSPSLPYSVLTVVRTYLENQCVLFEDKYMEQEAKEKMIQRNIRQVVLGPRDHEAPPKTVKLIESGVPTRRMILIIEGKAKVMFKSGMQFNAEAWSFFGDPLLAKIMMAHQEKKAILSSLSYKPDFDLIAEQPCKILQIPVSTLLYAFKISSIVRNTRHERKASEELQFEEDTVPTMRTRENRKSSLQSRHSLNQIEEERHRSVSTVERRQWSPHSSDPCF